MFSFSHNSNRKSELGMGLGPISLHYESRILAVELTKLKLYGKCVSQTADNPVAGSNVASLLAVNE